MKIRKGNTGDIISICKLLIATWQNCYTDFIPASILENLSLDKQIKRHEKYMAIQVKYLIAENTDNEIIGFASYGESRFNEVDAMFELYTLYVDQKIQGKGIGGLLINAVLNDLNSEDSIAVSVFEKNPYKSFYLKNGFEKVGEELIDLGAVELVGGIYRYSLRNEVPK
jgi:GNAT superfamily N-acetyltransferase